MRYELIMWVMALLKAIPGNIGCAIRRLILPGCYGARVKIWDGVQIDYPQSLVVGEDTSINRGSVLNCGGGIKIGSNVLIGPGVIVYSQNHQYLDAETLIRVQGYERKPVVIEDDVWVAARAIVLPGVTLARGCVIAAGAVVTKSTEPLGVYAGSPAVRIGLRNGGSEVGC